MEKEQLVHFKNLLMSEKKRVNNLLNLMKENEVINSNEELASELSFYDNHPSDSATELFDKEKGLALKANEVTILKNIDEALHNIEDGSYGTCKRCGKDIPRERLEFIPYTEYCVHCQNEMNTRPLERHDRPVEEDVLGIPFGTGYNDYKNDSVEFDAEDSYDAVDKFNKIENVEEYFDDDRDEDVDPIEKISNAQYRHQLPD
ncbi:TraR/DksA C4-type zinc finger protein [Clostridium sp. JN-9]|uniref:TraR/DksA C4-type zinc finger protein n=1 Tax=Clostridium sp. JN-9 TaxID=2507159 RepID=UPI000FFDFE0F|nr:TraR/DksA C4-type zinc finger protein [Clostridium sp. JN-9]QAT40024.1 yteA family sporulation protein [Clostridium sp. JN-9]